MGFSLKQLAFLTITILSVVVSLHVLNHAFTVYQETTQIVLKTTALKKAKEQSKFNSMAALYNDSVTCFRNSRKTVLSYLKGHTIEKDIKSTKHQNFYPSCSEKTDLTVLLTTRPSAFSSRAAIRMSWGRSDSAINLLARKEYGTSGSWRVIFAIGRQDSAQITALIKKEHEEFNDILLLDYADTYNNLPNKTMISLEWIGDNCKTKYMLKTDDDCFVNILDMVRWINTLDPNKQKYIGRVNTHMPVIRDPKHRNFVAKEDHELEVYRPYCAGGGYVLAGNILKNISDAGKKIKQIINEDAYMGMVGHALGIKPHNEERFLPYIFFGPSIKKLSACEWKSNFLMHGVIGKRQLKMHWDRLAVMAFSSICEKL